MSSPGPDNACRNPQNNRGGGGTLPNASSAHAGLWGWFEGAYSRTVSTAESAYDDVAGAVDHGYHAATHAIEAGYTVATDKLRDWINSIPDRIANASNWPQLRYWAEVALGAESFNVGVGVGAMKNLADGVWGLLKMLKMFVLAGLYEQVHGSQIAAAINPQTYLIAKAADLVMGNAMKEADEQAKAMVKELEQLFASPGQLFNAIGKEYKEKWDRFLELYKDKRPSSQFEAGEIVGDVLMDIIMLVQLAEGAVKLASKIPKLLAEAEKLAAKVPEIARWARDLGAVKRVEQVEDLAKVGRDTRVPRVVEEEPGKRLTPLKSERASAPKSEHEITGKVPKMSLSEALGEQKAREFINAGKARAAVNKIDISKLTDDEIGALYGYTNEGNDGYKLLNPALRGEKPMTMEIHSYVDHATSGLDKLPASPGPVFRGVNLPDSVAAKYIPGNIVTEKAFTSSSSVVGFEGKYQMTIESVSGRDISGFSQYPEGEILFKPGTQFEVLSRDVDSSGTVHLRMREIGAS